jgi:hypothetical protein
VGLTGGPASLGAAFPMISTDGPVFVFACHEGNCGLRTF